MKHNNEKKQMKDLPTLNIDPSIQHPSRKPSHRKTNSSIFFNGDYLFQPFNSDDNKNQPRVFNAAITTNPNETNTHLIQTPGKLHIEYEDNNLNYSSDHNNSSVIIKGEDNNKQPKLIESFVKPKSFVSLINTLVYAQDKQENATDSYMLALGLCDNRKKYNVISTSPIEEENTVLVTESDFTIKKSLKKSITIDSKEFPDSKNNNELKISTIAKTINDLIQKKREKENHFKNKLEINKQTLLSKFNMITNDKHINNSSNKDIIINKPLVIENAGQLKVLPQKKYNPSLSLLTNKLCLNKYNTNFNNNKSAIPFNSKPNDKIKKKNICHIETDYNMSYLNKNSFSNAVIVMNAKVNRINTSSNNNNTSITRTRSNSQMSKCKLRNSSWNISPRNEPIITHIKAQDQSQAQCQERDKIHFNNQEIELTLNHLTFTKSYEKQDALEKVHQGKKGCFLILCKCKNTFIGLFKYYQEKHRFIKVYGSELCQNIIFPENIISVCIDNGDGNYEILKEIIYSKSMIIFKKENEFNGLINE